MDTKKKLELIKRNAAEVLGEDKLKDSLKKKQPIVYCGYEPSGDLHIGHYVTILKLKDFEDAGFKVKILLADWHAWLNKKGDWEFIRDQVKKWEKVFNKIGLKNPEIVVGTSFQRKPEYFDDVFSLAANSTLNRGLRAMQGVARDIDHAKVTQLFYPFMQVADMKALKVDAVVSGMEQRKIHMIAVESLKDIDYPVPAFVHTSLIPSLKGTQKIEEEESVEIEVGNEELVLDNYNIFVNHIDNPSKRRSQSGSIISNMLQMYYPKETIDEAVAEVTIKDLEGFTLEENIPLVKGKSLATKKVGIAIKCLSIDEKGIGKVKILVAPGKLELKKSSKMSSSDKGGLISVKDSPEEIKKKISKAYCPEGEKNPVLDIARIIIFPVFEKLKISRPEKFGGNITYDSYEDLEKDFLGKKLHPMDLKNIVSEKLTEMFEKIK